MLKARVRLVGALVLGAALAFPIAASAQQSAPTPPVTAPTNDAGNVPAAPQPSVAPKPAAGTTAVPGWNNPPAKVPQKKG